MSKEQASHSEKAGNTLSHSMDLRKMSVGERLRGIGAAAWILGAADVIAGLVVWSPIVVNLGLAAMAAGLPLEIIGRRKSEKDKKQAPKSA